MGQCIPVVCFGVSEKGGIEVKPDNPVPGPFDPVGKVFRPLFVPIHRLASELGVGGVDIHTLHAGQKVHYLTQIGPDLVAVARLARIVSGGHDTCAGNIFTGIFQTADVIGLPAMERNGNGEGSLDGCIRVNPEVRVSVFRQFVCLLYLRCRRGRNGHKAPLLS